jgi:hypothetical protein
LEERCGLGRIRAITERDEREKQKRVQAIHDAQEQVYNEMEKLDRPQAELERRLEALDAELEAIEGAQGG